MNRLLSWFGLGIIFICSNSFIKAQIPHKERKALEELYHTTSGYSWSHTWNLNENVSSWYGVELRNGHVVAINLHNNGLQGKLPDNFRDLPYLEIVNLAFNKLSGELPNSLFSLSSLQVLRLEMNSLTGALPKKYPINGQLRELSLFNNQLSGEIPHEIGDLKSLRVLNLSSNFLTGSLPERLSQLKKLEQLELFGNELSGEISHELGNLESLKELILSYNHFEGDLPKSIADLENLNLVQLQGNSFNSVRSLKFTKSDGMVVFDSDDLIMNNYFKGHHGIDKTRMADTKFEDSRN